MLVGLAWHSGKYLKTGTTTSLSLDPDSLPALLQVVRERSGPSAAPDSALLTTLAGPARRTLC